MSVNPSTPPDAAPLVDAPPKRRRRRVWRYVLLVLLLVVGGLIGAAPFLASQPAIRNYALDWLNRTIRGRIEVEGASFSWGGPTTLRGLRVIDPDGREVLSVASADCQAGMWRLLRNWRNLPELVVDAPRADLYLDENGRISLADAFAPRRPRPDEPDEPLPEFRGKVTLRRGALRATRVGGASVDIPLLEADATIETLADIHGDFTAKTADGATLRSRFSLARLFNEGRFDLNALSADLTAATDGAIDLAPICAVVTPSAGVAGKLTLSGVAKTQGDALEANCDIDVKGLQATAGATAGAAPLDLKVRGTITRSASAVTGDAVLDCAAGKLQLHFSQRGIGSEAPFDAQRLVDALLAGGRVELPDLDLTGSGGLDLVRLQQALPGIIRLQPGTQLTGGRVEIESCALRGGSAPALKAALLLRDLAATRGGKRITIEPVRVAIDATIDPAAGLTIREGRIAASFAELSARGTPSDLKSEFRADLARLRQDLGQLFDLGSLRLAGELSGSLALSRQGEVRIACTLDLRGGNIEYQSGQRRLDAKQLALRQNAMLQLKSGALQRVEIADGQIDLDGQLVATTAGWYEPPRDAFSARTTISRGDIAFLSARADRLGVSGLAGLAGALSGDATIEQAGNEPLRTTGSLAVRGLTIENKPAVDGDLRVAWTDARFDARRDRLDFARLQLQSKPISADLAGSLDRLRSGAQLDLSGQYNASWEEFTKLLAARVPATRDTVSVDGTSSGPIRLAGPLAGGVRDLQGGTELNWSAARVVGVGMSAARLSPALAKGRLTIQPVTIGAAGGEVHLAGELDFTAAATTIRLPGQRTLLEHVEITPEMGRQLLSHINPLFGFMNRVEGHVSLATADIELPIGAAMKHGGAGRGLLDLGRLRIEPGGVFETLFNMAGLPVAELYPVEISQVDFVIREGRIHYDNFQIVFPSGFDMKFYGSVGFDDTLDLVISLPVTEGLLRQLKIRGPAANILGSGLRIDVPLVGTRLSPKLDFARVDTEKLLKSVLSPDGAKRGIDTLLRELGPGGKPKGEPPPEKPRRKR